MSYAENFDTDWNPPKQVADDSLLVQYLFAISWGVTVVTGVGSKEHVPETHEEMGFMLFVAVIVLFIVAVLIGSVVDLVATTNASAEQFRHKMSRMNLFMKNKHLPKQMRERV